MFGANGRRETVMAVRAGLPALICVLLGLSGCVGAPEPAGTATVGEDWSRATGQWSSGGALIVAAGLREDAGRVALCGAWTTTPQSVLSERHNVEVIEAGSAAVGGQRLATGLGFMAGLREGTPLVGATARCVRTERPWPPATAEVDIRLPRMEFEYDEFSGPLAVFRQVSGRR